MVGHFHPATASAVAHKRKLSSLMSTLGCKPSTHRLSLVFTQPMLKGFLFNKCSRTTKSILSLGKPENRPVVIQLTLYIYNSIHMYQLNHKNSYNSPSTEFSFLIKLCCSDPILTLYTISDTIIANPTINSLIMYFMSTDVLHLGQILWPVSQMRLYMPQITVYGRGWVMKWPIYPLDYTLLPERCNEMAALMLDMSVNHDLISRPELSPIWSR